MEKIKIHILAILLLPLLICAQTLKDSDAYFNFLQQLYFENTDGRYNDFLRQELQQHLRLYPLSAKQAQIFTMLAATEMKSGLKRRAFLNYLKTLFIYPKSASAQSVRKILPAVLDSLPGIQLKMNRDSILSEIVQITPLPVQEGWFEMISFIYSLEIDTLNLPLQKEIRNFRAAYGIKSKNDPILLFWRARLCRNRLQRNSALACYRELLALHPNTDLKKDVLLEMGRICHYCTGKAKQALEYYLETINSFAGTEEAASAQFLLACLYEDSLNAFDLALTNYQLYIDENEGHHFYQEGLARLARLAGRLKKWPQAAGAWQLLYEQELPDSTARAVLEHLSAIYLEQEKNYEQGAKILLLYALRFKDPEKMYAAARIYNSELHDHKRAKETFAKLLELFPKSEYADKAKEAVSKMK